MPLRYGVLLILLNKFYLTSNYIELLYRFLFKESILIFILILLRFLLFTALCASHGDIVVLVVKASFNPFI